MTLEVYAILVALVLLPALCALLALAIPVKFFRTALVLLVTPIMIAAAVLLGKAVIDGGGVYNFHLNESVTINTGWVIKGIDVVVLAYVLVRGVMARRFVSPALAVIQLSTLVVFEVFAHSKLHLLEPGAPVSVDYLSLVLILLVSVIGPLIVVFGIGYMDKHEEHLHLTKSRQPRFFAILFLFLSVMNALAMADNMMWMYTFWEITTLCSFLLISHDETAESIKNAFRTLDLNMLGGVALLFGVIAVFYSKDTLSLAALTRMPLGDAAGFFPIAIALLCLAGFTKSAQFPFQSWLLGAMVAPTPVSALLHSSTMVKAGVYLVVRMAPVMAGSLLGNIVSFAGGLTFMAASAIAISQRNGKRVLAYSTIANLGLVVCCAGIGTQAALAAAILLIIFHAVSKGLLFLCIGTIEQGIGSRDIEDMQGLLKLMPFTTFITVIGMISMLLPPFGVLMTKWLAVEASVHSPAVLILIILGSAFTVVVWAKWIGIILTMSYKTRYNLERLRPSMSSTLMLLLLGVLGASFAIVPLYTTLVDPFIKATLASKEALSLVLQGSSAGLWLSGEGGTQIGGVLAIPLFILVFVLVFAIPYFFYKTRPETVKPPYFGGELAHNDIRGIDFIGPGDKEEQIVMHNYYFDSIFGEKNLTTAMSLLAIGVILIMFGVVLG